MAKIDWMELEWEYMSSMLNLRELAEKNHLSYETVKHRAREEGWVQKRNEKRKGGERLRLEQVTDRMLWKLGETINKSEGLEAKEIKELCSALKELGQLARELSGEENKGREEMIIRLEGELEELGR